MILFCAEIRVLHPGFVATYHPDPVRQNIADSWPDDIDYSAFARDLGYCPKHNLANFSSVMYSQWKNKLSEHRNK
jgi:hypothetical protein